MFAGYRHQGGNRLLTKLGSHDRYEADHVRESLAKPFARQPPTAGACDCSRAPKVIIASYLSKVYTDLPRDGGWGRKKRTVLCEKH